MKTTTLKISAIIIALLANLTGMSQSKRHPVGTLRVKTEMPGELSVDSLPAQKISVYHQVVVVGIDTGVHTLTLVHDSTELQRKVRVSKGTVNQYTITHDSVELTSSAKGGYSTGYKSKINNYYLPRGKGLYLLAKLGFSSANSNTFINGSVIAGYQFSPVFSLGGGMGFTQVRSNFNQYVFLLIASSTIKNSTGFSMPYVPVFIDVRLNLNKKRVVPYFSLDIGCDFPFINSFDGSYDDVVSSIFGESSSHYTFHVDKVNPGFYLAINPGLKIHVYKKYYIDYSMGADFCFNKFIGKQTVSHTYEEENYSVPFSKVKTISSFHMTIGFGF